jgi:magnesium transporter
MTTIFQWNRQSRAASHPLSTQLQPSDLTEPDAFVWIDLENPSPEEEADVFERLFPLHHLEIEDLRKPTRPEDGGIHLPKAEEWENHLFVIINPLHPDFQADGLKDEVRAERPRAHAQLGAVLGPNALITHHAETLPCITRLRQRLTHEPGLCARGPDYLFHWMLDELVDEFSPAIDAILDQLEQLETEILHRPTHSHLQSLLKIKATVVMLRKTMILEREVLARLSRGEFELVSEQETIYYRNVYDHLVRYTELIEGAREMTADLLQTHLSAASNRLSEVMKTLTMISVVILPMTLVASIYGMNFEEMPGLKSPYGFAAAVSAMIFCGAIALVGFRWRRWL